MRQETMHMKRKLLMVAAFFYSATTSAQTNVFAKTDKDLTRLYQKLFSFYQTNPDSVEYYSNQFSERFTAFVKGHPASLQYPFKALRDSNVCTIVTSADGKLRLYSWDIWLGGTMHDFQNIIQFKSGAATRAGRLQKEEGDPGSQFTAIFSLHTGGNTYYLVTGTGTLSTKDAWETISVYSIAGDSLNTGVKLIKTHSGLRNSISFDYDFFSVADRPGRPMRLIRYDPIKKIISIPVVLEDGKVTNRFILYPFNGAYFEEK